MSRRDRRSGVVAAHLKRRSTDGPREEVSDLALQEEILKRELEIEVVDRAKYLRSNLIHGVRELPVQIH